ncbi:hypothetical protein [Rhizobium sp. NLR22b]|uniref:hypothetical protein n=1 Tax=Rhizobium sp. NLR22b TaxID=2731115 RepID=UPI001C833954|nr:hypothetical protein [Rhizobium sp. NLR22b]MBX5242752.1 hypothetical protein [Rhizobium sp. NLR22b]
MAEHTIESAKGLTKEGNEPGRRLEMDDPLLKPERLIEIPGIYRSVSAVNEKTGIGYYERLAMGRHYKATRYRRMPDGSRALLEKTTSGRIGYKHVEYLEGGEKIVDSRSHGENFVHLYYQRSDGSRFYKHKRYRLYENKATIIDDKTSEHSRTISFGSGYVRRYYDAGDGKKVLTGKKTLLESKFLIARSDGNDHVRIKRLGGLINRTYVSGDGAEIAAKGLDATEGRTIKRRVGFYRMEIGKNKEGQETTNHRIGRKGKLFSRTEWLDSKGRTVTQTTVLGITKLSSPSSGDGQGPLKKSRVGCVYVPPPGALPATRLASDMVSQEVGSETAPTLTRSRSLPDFRIMGSARRLQERNSPADIDPVNVQPTAHKGPGKQSAVSTLEEAAAGQSHADSARPHAAPPKPALPAGWQASTATNSVGAENAAPTIAPPGVQARSPQASAGSEHQAQQKAALTAAAPGQVSGINGKTGEVLQLQSSSRDSAISLAQSGSSSSTTLSVAYDGPDDDEIAAMLEAEEENRSPKVVVPASGRTSTGNPTGPASASRGRSASPAAERMPRQLDDRPNGREAGVSI